MGSCGEHLLHSDSVQTSSQTAQITQSVCTLGHGQVKEDYTRKKAFGDGYQKQAGLLWNFELWPHEDKFWLAGNSTNFLPEEGALLRYLPIFFFFPQVSWVYRTILTWLFATFTSRNRLAVLCSLISFPTWQFHFLLTQMCFLSLGRKAQDVTDPTPEECVLWVVLPAVGMVWVKEGSRGRGGARIAGSASLLHL